MKVPVEPKEGEEVDELEHLFYYIYEFHNPISALVVFVLIE